MSNDEFKKRQQDIIKSQNEKGKVLMAIQNKKSELEIKQKLLLSKLPTNSILENSPSKSSDIVDSVTKLFLNKERRIIVEKKLSKIPEYVEFRSVQKEYDKILPIYFKNIYDYYFMVNEDRKLLFSEKYLDQLDELADKGLFLYHLKTPDIPENIIFAQDCYSKIVDIDYPLMKYLFNNVIIIDKTDNELTQRKKKDLKEALVSLENKNYNSCARTLFALIENDHINASNLNGDSTGIQRADRINENLNKMGFPYYIHAWDKINAYYKKITINTKHWDKSIINRNDIIHGSYERKLQRLIV